MQQASRVWTPQCARRSFTKGFAGTEFILQPDGTLCCPAGHPLTVQERRSERNGSVRVVYGDRITHCRPCPLRGQCQEVIKTKKPRQVSAVLWPLDPLTSVPTQPPSRAASSSTRSLVAFESRCKVVSSSLVRLHNAIFARLPNVSVLLFSLSLPSPFHFFQTNCRLTLVAILVDRQPQFAMTHQSELLQQGFADACELCGSPEKVEVHHVRKLTDLKQQGHLPRFR